MRSEHELLLETVTIKRLLVTAGSYQISERTYKRFIRLLSGILSLDSMPHHMKRYVDATLDRIDEELHTELTEEDQKMFLRLLRELERIFRLLNQKEKRYGWSRMFQPFRF